MEEIEVRTTVYLPPDEVYAFLSDFPRYARYSKHLKSVTADGDGSPGTEYALRFAWWKVGYTVRSRVTDVDPPRRIGFEVTSGIDAEGEWLVEDAETADAPPETPETADDAPETPETADDASGGTEASLVRFVVRYDPDSVTGRHVDLPALVSLPWVIDKALPFVEAEAERVVERVVADLEGRRREVDLQIVR